MKITNEQLKQIIKEEIELLEKEAELPKSPAFINIILTDEGVRLSIKPKEGGKIPGVRIPKSAIDSMHSGMYNYITNVGIHYEQEDVGWHKKIQDRQVEANFYTILKRLIDKVDWGGSIGNYEIEDLKQTAHIAFSNYTGRKRTLTDQERKALDRQRKDALDR
jgi:hypothetical protein